jgi:hypothetical protein
MSNTDGLAPGPITGYGPTGDLRAAVEERWPKKSPDDDPWCYVEDVLALIPQGAVLVTEETLRGWWHHESCIDLHDENHNCLDEYGSITGWRVDGPGFLRDLREGT